MSQAQINQEIFENGVQPGCDQIFIFIQQRIKNLNLMGIRMNS